MEGLQLPEFDADTLLESIDALIDDNKKTEACPVSGCGVTFSTKKGAKRHWASIHLPMVVVFNCPIMGCVFTNSRADRIKLHITRQHPEATTNHEELARMTRFLPYTESPNRRFLNPGPTSPPYNLTFERPRFNPPLRFPPTKSTPTAPADETKPLGDCARAELLQRLTKAQSEVRKWEGEIGAIKKELKKREVRGEKRRRAELEDQKKENKKLKEEIRRKNEVIKASQMEMDIINFV